MAASICRAENLRHFHESLAYYNVHLRAAALADPAARQLDGAFRKMVPEEGPWLAGQGLSRLVAVKAAARVPAQFLHIEKGPHRLTPGRALYLAREKFGHGPRTAWYRDVVRPRIRERTAVCRNDRRHLRNPRAHFPGGLPEFVVGAALVLCRVEAAIRPLHPR